MQFETVKYERDGDVSLITFNRPDALNALSLQLTRDIDEAIRRSVEDVARAIVLTGSGRAFCSAETFAR